MTPLERRYRRLLLAYPRAYRRKHGDELLDVLLEDAAPGRRVPVLREAWGLLAGGVRSRIVHQATGSVWVDGVHLGVTAVAAVNLAALLPYAEALPLWTLLSALALLAILRGRSRTAFALTLLTGVKAVGIAAGFQAFDVTLLPVSPSRLTGRALFQDSDPLVVAAGYAVVLIGLAVLAWPRRPVRARSWWWWAVVVPVAWAGPQWLPEETRYPISLSRMCVEVAVFGLVVAAGYLTRDYRWVLASGIYLLLLSCDLAFHVEYLERQHLAYAGILFLLLVAAAFAPLRQRRHCLD
ncbi:unnamed protein product [[Actinomadura] parvosata subsp. kistnae]|uniref:Uncharacterized protein n=1 Tax=[Actinomadura] parvosata subsp. kistnae TaxID=1909395 RepID=A0A1V0ADF6_9ACTN|nr:hypothetical protein [Nonomuraea sp. ATCC 55076]AQZ68152.1 hypothetical protein BKM31_47785 [Nonomuraea sp. ATCC 55076]SPL93459.1 unnamed protein product [Actinomadura parvosata subsp. kistnae]